MAKKKKKASNPRRSGKKKVAKKAAKKKAQSTNWQTPEGWLTQKEAARLSGVSQTMFQRYELEPVKKRGRSTYYTEEQVLDHRDGRAFKKGYESGFREGKTAQLEDAAEVLLAKEQAELEWTRERAEGQRLKNAQMRRELAPVEMVVWALGSVASQVSAILGTLPAKLKRSQPKLSADEINIVKTELVKAQNACAKEVELAWDDYLAESD